MKKTISNLLSTHILVWFNLEQVFWNVGFVCRRLLIVSLAVSSEIESNWYKTNESNDENLFSAKVIKEEVMKLQKIHDTKEITSCIKVGP